MISLLALNGLRVSEATGADIEALGTERGHRTLAITRKGGQHALIPLAPRTARAIGERFQGPIFTTRPGSGWTGTAPGGSSAEPAWQPRSVRRRTHAAAPHGTVGRRSVSWRTGSAHLPC
jgi:integrase